MLFKILHGDSSNISLDTTPFHEGWCYVTHDGYFYVDLNVGTKEGPNNQRLKLNAKEAETLTGYNISTILNSSDVEIPTSKAVMAAMDNLTADDLGIYVQPEEPTDAIVGAIWIDTANDPTYMPPELPEITEADNGKVLMVVNGKLQLVSLNLSVDANGVVSM
jgi:hypothetical protein